MFSHLCLLDTPNTRHIKEILDSKISVLSYPQRHFQFHRSKFMAISLTSSLFPHSLVENSFNALTDDV